MPKMIQIRHVPDAVHRKLKARAAMEGSSLSDYLVREVTVLAEQPTIAETLAEIAKLPPVSCCGIRIIHISIGSGTSASNSRHTTPATWH
jgi:hypothetical protein